MARITAHNRSFHIRTDVLSSAAHRVFTKVYCYLGILLFTLLFNPAGVSYFTNTPVSVVHAATTRHLQAPASASYADTVLVMDNVNHIRDHDLQGYRFDAAQLYVDLAPSGDEIGLVEITSSPASTSL